MLSAQQFGRLVVTNVYYTPSVTTNLLSLKNESLFLMKSLATKMDFPQPKNA